MISNKTKYALKAVFKLSDAYRASKTMLASDIARDEKIPKKFLEAILLELKNKGILNSKKGKGGGYTLATDPKLISIGSVMKIFERSFLPLPCLNEPGAKKCTECKDLYNCKTRLIMRELYESMNRVLDKTSIQDIIDRSQNELQSAMYFI